MNMKFFLYRKSNGYIVFALEEYPSNPNFFDAKKIDKLSGVNWDKLDWEYSDTSVSIGDYALYKYDIGDNKIKLISTGAVLATWSSDKTEKENENTDICDYIDTLHGKTKQQVEEDVENGSHDQCVAMMTEIALNQWALVRLVNRLFQI